MITTKCPPPFMRQWAPKRQHKHSDRNENSISTPYSTPIFIEEKIVGEVRGNVFVKTVIASIHFLRKPPSIGFDTDSLKQAEKAGARYVSVIDTESGKVYRAPISTIWAHGFPLNRGYGDQIALRLEFWSQGAEPFGEQLKLRL